MRESCAADSGQEAEKVLFQHMPQPLLELSVSEGRPRWKKTNDAYGHENLIRYHTALAFVDHIQAEGFIGAADREAMYALIAQRYGIDKDSIFAA